MTPEVISSAGWILAGLFAVVFLIFVLRSRGSAARTRDVLTGTMPEAEFRLRAEKLLPTGGHSAVCVRAQALSRIGEAFGVQREREALAHMGQVLCAQLSGDELLTRVGGDCFCMLLRTGSREQLTVRLERIRAAFGTPSEKLPWEPGLCFGVCLPGEEGDPVDQAMLACRLAHDGQRCVFYSAADAQQREREAALGGSVEKALENGEFFVCYQPRVRLSDRKVVGAQALSRWRHPLQGLLSEDMYLPAAERCRKTAAIDRFVLTEVCRTLARWKEQERELCRISVNLAPEALEDPSFCGVCAGICREHGVEPSMIEFELRETLALEHFREAGETAARLHAAGFHFALSSFGSGPIALQLLERLDPDTVKLDGSFFDGERNNRQGRYIVEALLRLTTQLRIQSVAEEIGSPGQLQFLQQGACDMVQGLCFFKPMTADRFEAEVYTDKSLCYASAPVQATPQTGGSAAHTGKSIVLFSWNTREDTVEFSESFSPVLGNRRSFSNARALFRTTDLVHENDREDFFRLLERCQREEGWVENTLRFYVGEGRYGWLELRLRQEHGVSGGFISGTMVNLAEWKKEVERWKEKATRDPLTGVYNREHFESSVINQLERRAFSCAAMLFVDVDYFKNVNDSMGHPFGDDVLCYVAKQILGVFRHTDVIARYGGDEFVVFAPNLRRDVLEQRLQKLWNAFRYPYRGETGEYRVSVSIGASLFPEDGGDIWELLHHADCALYEAKKRGRDQFVIYEASMEDQK